MRTAKYRLSKPESARFHDLVIKHCIGEITASEKSELERLNKERDRRFKADPRNADYFRNMRNASRRIRNPDKKGGGIAGVSQLDQFSDELDRMVERFRAEYDLTYGEVVGALQMKIHLLCSEAEDREDEV